jgi:antitoxin component YwqK of YwqJK toxin-antitoxin module
MDTGTIDGDYTEWYESGKLRIEKTCKYGLVLSMKRYDENGNVVEEKNGLTDGETRIYKKRLECGDCKKRL